MKNKIFITLLAVSSFLLTGCKTEQEIQTSNYEKERRALEQKDKERMRRCNKEEEKRTGKKSFFEIHPNKYLEKQAPQLNACLKKDEHMYEREHQKLKKKYPHAQHFF